MTTKKGYVISKPANDEDASTVYFSKFGKRYIWQSHKTKALLFTDYAQALRVVESLRQNGWNCNVKG